MTTLQDYLIALGNPTQDDTRMVNALVGALVDADRFSRLHSWYKHLPQAGKGTATYYPILARGQEERYGFSPDVSDWHGLHWRFVAEEELDIYRIVGPGKKLVAIPKSVQIIARRHPIPLDNCFGQDDLRGAVQLGRCAEAATAFAVDLFAAVAKGDMDPYFQADGVVGALVTVIPSLWASAYPLVSDDAIPSHKHHASLRLARTLCQRYGLEADTLPDISQGAVPKMDMRLRGQGSALAELCREPCVLCWTPLELVGSAANPRIVNPSIHISRTTIAPSADQVEWLFRAESHPLGGYVAPGL